MRLTAKNYNRIVPRLIADVKKDLAHADDAILESLTGGAGEISRWPADQEFTDYIRAYPVYGVVGQPRLIMALAAVERNLYSTKTDMPVLAASLSLEHLLPQEWTTHWPLPEDLTEGARQEAEQARQDRLHRLGNLSIVIEALNSSMSSSPWETKKKQLNRHSRLLLNARLEELGEWTTDAVDKRGDWLAAQLALIWPGPSWSGWHLAMTD